MAGSITTYGDISPRTAAYAVAQMLKRALPHLVLERWGQSQPIPKNSTKTAKFRRYFLAGATGSAGTGTGAFFTPLSLTPLVEGVTPSGKLLAHRDYEVTLEQFGDFVTITDVVRDTHEDPVLSQATDIMGEEAAQVLETLRFNVLKAGTNVFYSNGVARADVNTPLDINVQRRAIAALLRQNAKPITSMVASTPAYRTEPVEAAFMGYTHPDMEVSIRKMPGFISTKQYGTTKPMEMEIGSVERVRYITSTIAASFPDAGAVGGTNVYSTTGTNADVYPTLVFARDAYGLVPLKGENSMTPMVVNPKPAAGDPLAQRGTVGWKLWHATVILQDAFMLRIESAASTQ
jgi:N4-gp56 family major capsid protein